MQLEVLSVSVGDIRMCYQNYLEKSRKGTYIHCHMLANSITWVLLWANFKYPSSGMIYSTEIEVVLDTCCHTGIR